MTRTHLPRRGIERRSTPSGRTPAPADVPVFVDRTGRRRRLLAFAGVGGSAVMVVIGVAVVIALSGAAGHPLPGLPAAKTTPHTAASTSTAERTAGPASHTSNGPAAPSATSGSAPHPSPAPQPTTAPAGTVSPTPNPHRHVPTQTPSHGNKK